MDHVEYVYTTGMSAAEVEEQLQAGEHGVLGLADEDDAYAIPLSYHYDGERLLLRVSEHDDDSEKKRFLETTRTATFLCYAASTTDSWSIHIRGPIKKWPGEVDEAIINKWFPPFRVFDEAVENVEFSLWELQMDTVIGRKTIDG